MVELLKIWSVCGSVYQWGCDLRKQIGGVDHSTVPFAVSSHCCVDGDPTGMK